MLEALAQVWLEAASTAVAVVNPLTCTGESEPVVVLFPSCPELLYPQHQTIPAPVTAQVKKSLAEIPTRPESPGTATGASLPVVVPVPS